MPPPLLVGSVGPYGAALHDGSEYTGCYAEWMSEEQLMAWHRPRIRALDQAGVRLLAVETIPALSEARAVLKLLRLEYPHLRAWVSFSCKVTLSTSSYICWINQFIISG
jgi:S-methylmethionine-dependent homocysteine/selenocysteine methylase